MTWLATLNFFVVQWFGVRVARVAEADGTTSWGLLRYVLPLTGWWSDYVWLWRRWPRPW